MRSRNEFQEFASNHCVKYHRLLREPFNLGHHGLALVQATVIKISCQDKTSAQRCFRRQTRQCSEICFVWGSQHDLETLRNVLTRAVFTLRSRRVTLQISIGRTLQKGVRPRVVAAGGGCACAVRSFAHPRSSPCGKEYANVHQGQ